MSTPVVPAECLKIFATAKRIEMGTLDLIASLNARRIRIPTDELLDTLGSIDLFKVRSNAKGDPTIQFSPLVTLCENFLQGTCKNKLSCSQFHVCRHVHHKSDKPLDKPCNYAHKLSDLQMNTRLLRAHQYDRFDEDVLLDLLRLYHKTVQSHVRPDQSHAERESRLEPTLSPASSQSSSAMPAENAADKQLDISLPPTSDAPDVDLEVVQLLLERKGITIVRVVNDQISNDFYRRFTLELFSRQGKNGSVCASHVTFFSQTSILPLKMATR